MINKTISFGAIIFVAVVMIHQALWATPSEQKQQTLDIVQVYVDLDFDPENISISGVSFCNPEHPNNEPLVELGGKSGDYKKVSLNQWDCEWISARKPMFLRENLKGKNNYTLRVTQGNASDTEKLTFLGW